MESIRVAAVSINSVHGDVAGALDAIDLWTRRAVEQGAELVLFPELHVHGHCTPNTWELAESVPGGPTIRRLERLARDLRVFLSVGLSEKEQDLVYNTQVLIGPDEYHGKQRKLHMSRDEHLFYKEGRHLPVFDIGKCQVGMIICYDNQFPEVARVLALRGADILLMPHAARIRMWDDTPESAAAARRHTHDYFVSCYAMRARENGCFALLTNQSGRAGYVDMYPRESPLQPHHCGGAMAFGPEGDLLAITQPDLIQDEMIVETFEAGRLAAVRSAPNYTLRTRRPELYGEIVKEQVRW